MAVVAGLVIVSLLSAVRSPWWLPGRAGALLVRPLVLIPVTLLVVVMVACRVVATRRSLASRTRLVVLAPDSFDPSVDAVLRCAAQLSRVRRVVGGWLDPRARAVRVLLDCDTEGRMRYSLSVPERALPAVRSALGVYDRVQAHVPEPIAEIREIEEEEEAQVSEADPESKEPGTNGEGSERRLSVVRAELRLARSSSEPLAHLPLSPDPLQGFARVLAGLDREHGEQAEIAVDLLPATPGTRRRLRRRLLRQARHRDRNALGGNSGLLDILGDRRSSGRARPAEMVEQRAAREEIGAKLLQHDPLFGMQILVRCSSPEKGRAVNHLQGLLGCFDAFAGANSFRVVGVRLLGLAFAGSDLPGRRDWFDRRMNTGLFRPARRNGYVTAREMAGLLKPPTVHCAAPDVLRLGPAVYPAPKTLPTFDGQAGLVPLGRVEGEHGERRIGLRVEDSFFTYTAGRSRWGKTESRDHTVPAPRPLRAWRAVLGPSPGRDPADQELPDRARARGSRDRA